MSERKSVLTLILERLTLPFAIAGSPTGPQGAARVVAPCFCCMTALLKISYELVSCAANLSCFRAQAGTPRPRQPLGGKVTGERASLAERALHLEPCAGRCPGRSFR